MSRRRLCLALPFAALALQGCIDSHMTGPDGGPASGNGTFVGICEGTRGRIWSVALTYVGAGFSVQVGDSVIVRADVIDERCESVAADLMNSWSSSSPILDLRPLGPSGEMAIGQARDIGHAEVLVSINGKEGRIPIQIFPRIATVTINPVEATLQVGDSVFVSATVTDTAGRVMTEPSVDYRIGDINTAYLQYRTNGAWVKGYKPGSTLVHATIFKFDVTSSITVIPRSSN